MDALNVADDDQDPDNDEGSNTENEGECEGEEEEEDEEEPEEPEELDETDGDEEDENRSERDLDASVEGDQSSLTTNPNMLEDTRHSRSHSRPGDSRVDHDNQGQIRNKIVTDLSRQRARQQSKYNSKNSTQRAGRPKGSKAKQDSRVKLDKGGLWE